MDDQRGIIKDQPVVSNNHDQEDSDSSSSSTMAVDQAVSQERAIDQNKKEKGVLDGNVLEPQELEDETVSSCAIDVKLDDDDDGREIVCRICHLTSDQSPGRDATRVHDKMKESSLIKLGCGCKDELGVAHSHCAEAWFKLKGNRICEICGEAARNIRGIIQEPMVVVEWTEPRSYAASDEIGSYSPERNGRWWRGQPCCNLLMACLIVSFVLPWFFRVKID